EEMTVHLPCVVLAAELTRCCAGELPRHRASAFSPRQILFKRVDESDRANLCRHADADARHVAVNEHDAAGLGFALDYEAHLFPSLRDAHEEIATEHCPR